MLEYYLGHGELSDRFTNRSFRLGDSLAGKAALERRIVKSSDTNFQQEKMAGLINEEGISSYYAVPLITKGQIKGVLELYKRSEIIENSDDDVDFLSNHHAKLSDDIAKKTASNEVEVTNQNQFPIILIIDDNADIRSYIAGHLKNEYHTVTAKDGLDGLEKATSQIPDLIISDVMMPNMNGIELCSAIKTNELTNHIPIILLTVRASDDSKIEGLDIGADDYITKPFEIKELKARIRNLIEQRRQLQRKYNRGYGLQPSEIASSSADERFLKKTLSLLEANISESNFGVEQLAGALSVHRTQLYRKLRAITGQTAVEFIRSVRLNRAAQLLQNKHDNIAQIAYEVGFSNPSYFSSSFYKQFGMYPTEYVKKVHQ